MDVLLSGDEPGATALESALRELGLDADRFDQPLALAEMMVALENVLECEVPRLALGVGAGDASLALVITAAKLGVPVAACLDGDVGVQADEHRIVATLASFTAGPAGDASRAAGRVVSWLENKATR